MTEDISEEQLAKYLMESGAYPVQEEKYNIHLFLHRVATADDTTKVGNLKEEELGIPLYPARTLKNLGLISSEIIGNTFYGDFFNKEAEILTSTSLSKEGFLIRQATTTTRQVADITKAKKANKGWFRKKEKDEEPS